MLKAPVSRASKRCEKCEWVRHRLHSLNVKTDQQSGGSSSSSSGSGDPRTPEGTISMLYVCQYAVLSNTTYAFQAITSQSSAVAKLHSTLLICRCPWGKCDYSRTIRCVSSGRVKGAFYCSYISVEHQARFTNRKSNLTCLPSRCIISYQIIKVRRWRNQFTMTEQ